MKKKIKLHNAINQSIYLSSYTMRGASLIAQLIKNLPAMQETLV